MRALLSLVRRVIAGFPPRPVSAPPREPFHPPKVTPQIEAEAEALSHQIARASRQNNDAAIRQTATVQRAMSLEETNRVMLRGLMAKVGQEG